ncbi:chorismate-binding protein [Escherichia coli]
MEIIDELEPQRRNECLVRQHWRSSFCGNMDTSITIRTLTAINGQIYCSAGGGIVADSQEKRNIRNF